ncbi:MAG: hypothetical protein FWD60_13945 [Candidatus Azobacteroides sp.]|nr:hypothetical protein [Candidatus Azobacteroides sp.]
MKKSIYLVVFCLSLLSHVYAQDTKMTIAITAFNGTVDGNRYYWQNVPATVQSVQDDIEKAFVKASRFTVVDRSTMAAWYDEKKRQQTQDFALSDKDLVEQGKNLGADYLVTGNINIVSSGNTVLGAAVGSLTTGIKTPDAVEAILKIIKVETGEIICSENIKGQRGHLDKKIDDFIDRNLPFSLPIIEVQGDEITLAPGEDSGIKKGDLFVIYKIVSIDVQGKKMTRKTELGTAKVTKLEGDFLTCQILQGAQEIQQFFAQNIPLTVMKKKQQ